MAKHPHHSHEHGHRHGRRGQRGTAKISKASGSYWLYGAHAVASALANPERKVRRILSLRDTAFAYPLESHHPRPEIMEQKEMVLLLGPDSVHQGIAIEVEPLEQPFLEEVIRGDKPLVILDQVTDPHNVGAILRSAAAFDAAAVIIPKDNAAGETAVMAKTASGALDIVPLVTVTNLATALRDIQEAGYWVAGLSGDATYTFAEAKLGKKTALVLGAEGRGMRRLTAESCDVLVKLPISERMESLNVSNAAAIALCLLYNL